MFAYHSSLLQSHDLIREERDKLILDHAWSQPDRLQYFGSGCPLLQEYPPISLQDPIHSLPGHPRPRVYMLKFPEAETSKQTPKFGFISRAIKTVIFSCLMFPTSALIQRVNIYGA